MAESQKHHPRLILGNFLSPQLCKELEFIHKSCCTVGYRPNVFSTTLPHLIATNSAHLIMPLIPIRERLKEKVEEHFGCEYELVVEFTGLISWCKEASIGWHSDDNRYYLTQRDFAAVCYLNSCNEDFEGGLFHFQDGEPSTVVPTTGDVIMYTADSKNIHSVDEITKGERITLTLWFSRDASHDEDTKLLMSLSGCSIYSPESPISSCFPVPASNNMYWFPPEEASKFQSGLDIRYGRLSVLGFSISLSDEKRCVMAPDSSSNFLNLLNDPLYLVCGDELLTMEFVNVLHALQVVQFYYWKVSESKTAELNGPSISVKPISESQLPIINCLKVVFLKDSHLAEMLFGDMAGGRSLQWSFDSVTFYSEVSKWEAYTYNLRKQLAMSLPRWKTHQSIFSIVSLD